jgi:hypothetical protein
MLLDGNSSGEKMIRIPCAAILVAAAAIMAAETVEKSSAYFSFPPAAAIGMSRGVFEREHAFSLRQEKGTIRIAWDLPVGSRGGISLCTPTGRIVASFAVTMRSGSLVWRPPLAHGLYIAALSLNGAVEKTRIILK